MTTSSVRKQNYSSSSSPRWAAASCFLFMAAAAATAQGKGDGVEVLAPAAELADMGPGGIVNFSFRVTNVGAADEEFIESLELPPGWLPIIPMGTLKLEAGEAVFRIVAVQVPRVARAGRHKMTYAVRSQRDYAIQDADTVTVVVTPLTEIALILEESPDTAIAGDEYYARLRLMNHGNTEAELRLELRGASKHPTRIEPKETTLGPGASQTVLLTVKTDRSITERMRHACQVSAYLEGADSSKPVATETILVDILPQAVRKFDPYHRIPARLSLRAASARRGAGLQLELEGAGPLRETGRAEIDFLLRGPDTQYAGIFGRRSEYRLSYLGEDMDVLLGDQAYELSRLTDYAQYGRGVGFAFRPSHASELGCHYVTDRWGQLGTQQIGAYVGGDLGDRADVRLNFLHRMEQEPVTAVDFDDTVWSVETNARLFSGANLSLEYGESATSLGTGSHDRAYRAELDGSYQRRAHYSLTKIHAGPDYRGSYRDCDYAGGSIAFRVAPRLEARLSYQAAMRNLERRPERDVAPREDRARVGVRYSVSRDLYVSLDLDDLNSRDALVPARYWAEEKALGLGLGGSSDTYSYRLNVRLGQYRDRLTSQTSGLTQCAGYASYRPSKDQLYTVYASVGDDEGLPVRLLGSANNVGASAAWEPNDRLKVALKYLVYRDERHAQEADLLAVYRQPDETSWEIRARRYASGSWGDGENAFLLSYTRPIYLPASRKRSIGSLRGVVFDAEDPERRGISRAVLSIGDLTATANREGRYVFGSLPPGTYAVSVHGKSIGLERTATARLPLEAHVEAGQVTELDIGITRAARLSGTAMVGMPGDPAEKEGPGAGGYVFGGPDAGGPEPGTALAGVLVELADGDEVHRRTTDGKGRFLFDYMRPGKWRLKVYKYNLPAFHEPEPPERLIELRPGETQDLTIEIVPRRRRIQMMDTGEPEVISAEPQASQPDRPERHTEDAAPGSDRPQPPSTTARPDTPATEAGTPQGTRRKVLPPLGKVKLIDRSLLRR